MNQEKRLESWKEIEAYLKRDFRTLRRWEKDEGLPVHRHSHKSRSSVYAYPSEIDAWRVSRKVVPEPPPARPLWKIPAFALTMLLCLVMVGNGVRPVSAQQAKQSARQVWAGSGVDGSGAVSPDGRYLSFTNYETGDLGLRDLIAGTTRFLTNTGGWEKSGDYTARSVISPDGKRIVYHWFLQKEHRNELRVVSLDGTESPRTVYPTDKGSADYILPWGWTPDGKRVVAVRELADHTNQMLMVSIDGRSPVVIKSLGWQYAPPAISPDGRFVAYGLPTDPKTGARDIFVLATDGSQEAAVVQGPTDDFSPQWSPDGGSLLFFSNRTGTNSLWSIPVGDGKVKGAASVVKADTGNIKPLGIASNGAYYYISPGAGGPDIYTVELDAAMKAARKPVLLAERFVNHNRYPMPSPDGKRLAYYSNRPENKDMLVIRTLETGEERDFPLPLPSLGIYGVGPAWFPDAGSVLVTLRDPQKPGVGYYRFDLANGKAEMLLRTVAYPDIQGWALSPDGKAIFYSESSSGEAPRLMRFDIETRRETELRKGEWVLEMAVSPDSKQLAYLVTADNSTSYLALQPADGGPEREVFRDSPWNGASRHGGIAWTPDQRYLVYPRDDRELWRVPVEGGKAERIGVHTGGGQQFSPDGRRLFFWENNSQGGEVWVLENFLPKAAVR